MLTLGVVLALAVGVYGQRAIGAVLVDTDTFSSRWRDVLDRVPLAIISAVIVLQTLTSRAEMAIDARAIGMVTAGLCAWRRAPIFVTVLAAAGATALARRVA